MYENFLPAQATGTHGPLRGLNGLGFTDARQNLLPYHPVPALEPDPTIGTSICCQLALNFDEETNTSRKILEYK